MDADGKPPQSREPETTKQKSERLKAARLQAELDRNGRVDRATRKAVARRKILGNDKS